jgi:hypothetical protein
MPDQSLTRKETLLWRRLNFDGFQVLDDLLGLTRIQVRRIKWCKYSKERKNLREQLTARREIMVFETWLQQ